jgi:hypothetical protein
VVKNPKITANEEEVKDCNIETQENPKIVRMSKILSPEVKQEYINLMKDLPDVFTWRYDKLKVYDTKVIQHNIPLKEDQRPFKQKLRWINPRFIMVLMFNMFSCISYS